MTSRLAVVGRMMRGRLNLNLLAGGVAIPGRSLMSMNALLIAVIITVPICSSDHRFYHCSLVIWVTADCRALMEISISLIGTIQSVTLSHLEGLFKVIQGQMENQKENLI